MNADNDHVVVYRAVDGYRWHRVDDANGNVVSESGEAYVDLYGESGAHEAAIALNPGVDVLIEE